MVGVNILKEIEGLEEKLNVKLPFIYKKFLCEEVKDIDSYEVESKKGDFIYIFNFKDLIERNETYTIQDVDPGCLMIGQDGDLGYFIRLDNESDKVYSLDLGALGSLAMDEEASDIYDLIK